MKKNIKVMVTVFMAASLFFGASSWVFAHCEIPCGIYDDKMRIEMIREHIDTIEKSMKEIRQLESSDHSHSNQLIRWVVNKEDHAEKLQHIVSQYFMTQRIKLDAEKYTEKVSVLHHMLIFAMKCKQTTDIDNVEKLRKLVDQFESLYIGEEKNH